jgi:hypothetical protein
LSASGRLGKRARRMECDPRGALSLLKRYRCRWQAECKWPTAPSFDAVRLRKRKGGELREIGASTQSKHWPFPCRADAMLPNSSYCAMTV